MKRFNVNGGYIQVDHNTYDGNPVITSVTEGDACTDGTEVNIRLDNYQTYQLAMALLAGLEVGDTRGSR